MTPTVTTGAFPGADMLAIFIAAYFIAYYIIMSIPPDRRMNGLDVPLAILLVDWRGRLVLAIAALCVYALMKMG